MNSEYEIILDSVNEGVFTVDRDWKIRSFNRAAEKITGVLRKDAIGKRCSDVFHANICENECTLRKTLDTGVPTVCKTACIISNKGMRIPIRISTAVLRNDKGKIIGGVETFQDLSQLNALKRELQNRHSFEDIVGRSTPMQKLFDILPLIAESRSTVLIEGASGTGKELFAKAIHNLSPRKKKPFIAVNCAALPDALLESELFGYKAGAFTDAKKDKAGRFLLADGGSIFLDEIGDISQALQVRLLRVLQERLIEPLGSTEAIPINVRIIAATNKKLKEMVKNGTFREDLYYRIRVVHMELPELKYRKEDIPLLIEKIIDKFNRLQDRDIKGISPEAMQILMDYEYPGNIRELENIIEQSMVLCRTNIIEPHQLPLELRPNTACNHENHPANSTIQQMEKQMIERILWKFNGNRRKAASELGINPSTLFRKIKALSINVPDQDGRYKQG